MTVVGREEQIGVVFRPRYKREYGLSRKERFTISVAMPRNFLLLLLPLLLAATLGLAQPAVFNATLDGYDYPYPVETLPLSCRGF